MYLSRLRAFALRGVLGRGALKSFLPARPLTTLPGNAKALQAEERLKDIKSYNAWTNTILSNLNQASSETNASKFVAVLKDLLVENRRLTIWNIYPLLTDELILAQTNHTIGPLLLSLGPLKLDCCNCDERYLMTVSLLFKKASSLSNMSGKAMLKCIQGLVNCGMKWNNIRDVSEKQTSLPGTPLALSATESKRQFLENLSSASLEILDFRTSNSILIGLNQLGLKYSDLPRTLQTELFYPNTQDLRDNVDLCHGTLSALYAMGFKKQSFDDARKAYVVEMLRVCFDTELNKPEPDKYRLFRLVVSTMTLGPQYNDCPPDLVNYVKESLHRVELNSRGILTLLDRFSASKWPWVKLLDSFSANAQAILVETLPQLSDDDFTAILGKWAKLNIAFEDFSQALQDRFLAGIVDRHFSGLNTISILSSMGKMQLPWSKLPEILLECLVPFLTVEVDGYDDCDVVTTIEALAKLGLKFSGMHVDLKNALENAILYKSNRFSVEQVEAVLTAFRQMDAPMDSLSPALQKTLISCTMLFDQTVPLMDQLSQIGARYVNFDKLSRQGVIKYLETHFRDLQHLPGKVIESMNVLIGCDVRWQYLTPPTHHIIFQTLLNSSQHDGPQLSKLIQTLTEFGVPWVDLKSEIRHNLLMNISKENVFTNENAAYFVEMLTALVKAGAPNRSLLRIQIRNTIQSCSAGLQQVELFLPLLKALAAWEMSLASLNDPNTVLLDTINGALEDCRNLEDLSSILVNVALLIFDWPPEWGRAKLQRLHQNALSCMERLARGSPKPEYLNKLAVYNEVYGMLCDPLVVVKHSYNLPTPGSVGLYHPAHVLPPQKYARKCILESVGKVLTSSSSDYSMRRDCYLVNNIGFAIDAAVYYKNQLVCFVDVDMDQYHDLRAEISHSPAQKSSNISVVYLGGTDKVPARRVSSENTLSNLTRVWKLRDKIHARYYRDSAPIFRTMPILHKRTISRENTELLSAKVAEEILEYHKRVTVR